MSRLVTVKREGEISIVTIDNPPVNALSAVVRSELAAAMTDLAADQSCKAIVITCAGRTFIAGADISEFGTPKQMQKPILPDLIALIERIAKPTIAAIHGSALGGGLELALSCHFRVADDGAKLGLPEVKLGLIPGSGGTVRLPRLAGALKALDMIVTGVPVSADDALSVGLVDHVAEPGSQVEMAVEFARARVAECAEPLPVRARDEKVALARTDMAAFDTAVDAHIRRTRGLQAPLAAARSLRNALELSFDEALAKEREIFLDLVGGMESRAMRHGFFAEREAAKVPGIENVSPRDVKKIGLVGAGTMGGGIAMCFANAEYPVLVMDMSDEALDQGFATIERNYMASVSRGSLSQEEVAARMGRLSRSTDYADLKSCDLIIEAVFEDMDVKRQVFGMLARIARAGTILATNTSYLDVNAIAEATSRASDVVGLHFFSPANVMKLLEIVRGAQTAPDVLATAVAVGRRIGKTPVVVGVCHGFVGNRMLAAQRDDTEALLLEGATPEQVDKAFTDFGWPMGPFQMGDMAGLDIGWRNRKAQGKKAAVADWLCEQGRFGQKTGRGFYVYQDGARKGMPDPSLLTHIERLRAAAGIRPRDVSAEEIIERTLYAMINEGAMILQEGIAARASDIDVVWLKGYGFPQGKGGPMFLAGEIGLQKIVDRLNHWHEQTGKMVYRPATLLLDRAAAGQGF